MGVIIEDLEACDLSGRFYGGNAGRKIGIAWRDADWLVKFPGPTGQLEGSVPSYTTAPVFEWLESHVYGLLGIPAHETVLGIRDGRIVCACKDFTGRDRVLVDFHDLKNSLSDDEPGFASPPSTGSCLVVPGITRTGACYGDRTCVSHSPPSMTTATRQTTSAPDRGCAAGSRTGT